MKTINNIIVPGSNGKPISIDVCYKNNSIPKPVVIFVHGFKGFKDWGHFNLLSHVFAQEGFVFVKFNFSHNGTTLENPTAFDDLESFGNNNYIYELNDLENVINWVIGNDLLKNEVNPNEIYLLGHSRGGGISILKAAQDLRVKKLVTWASVSDFINRNKQKTIEDWKETGVVYTFNARTKQNMPLYYQFYETILQNKNRLNICKAAASLKIPFLIIHGTKDEAVSHEDAEILHKANISSELFLIDGATHTFGAKHPYGEKTLPADADNAVKKTISFLKKM